MCFSFQRIASYPSYYHQHYHCHRGCVVSVCSSSWTIYTHFDIGEQDAYVVHVVDEQLLELGIWIRIVAFKHLLADVVVHEHWQY